MADFVIEVKYLFSVPSKENNFAIFESGINKSFISTDTVSTDVRKYGIYFLKEIIIFHGRVK